MIQEIIQTGSAVASRLSVPSSLSSLSAIRTFIKSVCESSPVLDADSASLASELAELELGTTEVASNIIRHGFEGLPEGSLSLECEIDSSGQFVLKLIHKGRSFRNQTEDPTVISFPQEGGMGMYLISQCIDSVDNIVRPDGTNEVQLKKTMTLNNKGNRNE